MDLLTNPCMAANPAPAALEARASRACRTFMVLAVIAGCQAPPEMPHPAAPRPVVDLQRFTVATADGRLLGTLVQREIRDPRAAIRYYLVETSTGQWLGMIDDSGRVYRYEPFAERERFVGMYSMEKALGLLYDTDGPLRITADGGPGANAARRPDALLEAVAPQVAPGKNP